MLIAVKAAVLFVLGLVFGIKGADRWLFALALAQAGEFGFVLLSFTVASGVIPPGTADQLLLIVALSMLLTPALFILFDRVVAPRFAVSDTREADTIEESADIIICGHGRIGGIVNRMLRGAGYETTVIDYSSAQLEMLKTFGLHVYFGDATRPDLLKAAGIDKARLLVVAINDKEQITELVRYVLKTYPNVHVMARAVDRHHVYELWGAGCRDVIRETYDSSIRMGRSAFEAMGLSREGALEVVAAFDEMDRRAMREVADLYDPDIPATENEPYVRRVREMREEWEAQLLGKMQDVIERHTPKRA